MSRLPTLFVSHGSPMVLAQPSPARDFLSQLGASLPRASAILVVSAHWTTGRPTVSNAARPRTIHDFHGFPPQLYDLHYQPPGAPELAERVAELTGAETAEYGLDHGAWVPLLLGWPDEDIPVTQLSVQPALGPLHHYQLGQKLALLREAGVLVLASGALTHNLRAYFSDDPRAMARSQAFAGWMAETVAKDRIDDLLNYRTKAPDAAYAHPTDEHLLPLYVALGAADGAGRVLHRSFDGNLAMDAYAWG
ncbi:MAG TPA: class III extradiol ring-cleavage dioxygenase [Magnetospirillum sp.]|jgi:4,5-DOPA dioxygenase extradiol|nr:class III extradiol ring-cleavage dioxygenase [Magnetospirillum sp.]